MKTAISIGVMTVLSGVGAVAWAQAPTQQPAPTQQTEPHSGEKAHAQQTAQRSDESVKKSSTAPARENAAAQAASLPDAAKATATQRMELQAMDGNKDGLVSRQEYMAHYESLYADMKKDSAGMISLKDLSASPTTGQPDDSATRSRVDP